MTRPARGDRHRRAAAVASTSLGRARHLGLAARYLPDDAELRQQAATELGRAGVELLAVSHVRDGLQLLRRGLELGLDDPEALLQLAETEIDIGETTPALAVLDRIATDGDSRMEVLVAHARANALRSTDAERSAALLADVAVRWTELGDQVKHAWALSNRGMTLFELGRTEEAAAEHDAALAIFTRLGDRLGMAAASQALALERPDDPHVPA